MGIIEDRSPLKILKEGRAWYSNAPPPAKPSRASRYVSGRFTYSIDKLRGVGSFFKLTIYPAYSKTFFLAEAALVKFRAHGNLVALETKCWMAMNVATKCGGGTQRGTPATSS